LADGDGPRGKTMGKHGKIMGKHGKLMISEELMRKIGGFCIGGIYIYI